MKTVIKDEIKCDNASYCGAKRHCPSNAIIYDAALGKIVIDAKRCIGCGICVKACPRAALSLQG